MARRGEREHHGAPNGCKKGRRPHPKMLEVFFGLFAFGNGGLGMAQVVLKTEGGNEQKKRTPRTPKRTSEPNT